MNGEQIIRNIKLSVLTGIKLEEPYLSLYKEIKDTYSNLNFYKPHTEEFKHRLYFGKSTNKLAFYYSTKSEELSINKNILDKLYSNSYGNDTISKVCIWYIIHFKLNDKVISEINLGFLEYETYITETLEKQ